MGSVYVDEHNLVELLEFLEDQYYENKVYFGLSNPDNDAVIELENDKSEGSGWYIGLRGGKLKIHCKAEDVLSTVENLGGDPELLATKIVQRCLSIASYATLITNDVSDILGTQAIIDNIEAQQKFTNELMSTIQELLGVDSEEKKPKLRLIKEEKE